jgi:hypothetical protein
LKLQSTLLCFIALSLSVGGCAFTQANLNIVYDEAKASKGPLSNIPARQLMIGEFKDVRPERDKIG